MPTRSNERVADVLYGPCTVVWPIELFKRVRKVTVRSGLSVSDLAALALNHYLRRHMAKPQSVEEKYE
jgi:hypothetical protein